jgi:hypothetical protein
MLPPFQKTASAQQGNSAQKNNEKNKPTAKESALRSGASGASEAR